MRERTRSSTKRNLFKASNLERLTESERFKTIVKETRKATTKTMNFEEDRSIEDHQIKELTELVTVLATQVQELVKIQADTGRHKNNINTASQVQAEIARNVIIKEYKSEENFEEWYEKFSTYLSITNVPEEQHYNYLKLYLTGDAMNMAREYDQDSYIELVEQLKKEHTGGMEKVTARETLRQIKRKRNLRYDELEKVSSDVEKCCKELLKRKSKEDRIQEQIDIIIELLPSDVQQHVEDREFYEWNHFIAVVKSKYDLEKRKKFDDERFRKIDKGKKSLTSRSNGLTNPENKTDTKRNPIICNSCGKQGHIAKNCYSKKEIKKTALLNVTGEEKNNNTNNTDEASEERVKEFSKLLYNSIKYKEPMPISNINSNRIFLTPCRIYNMEVIGAIDTCADCTIISRHLKDCLKLEESDKEEKLSVTDGHISLKKLKGNLSITINDNTYELHDTLVAKHDFEGFDILLGTNLLKRLNAVLDCQTGKLIFDEDKTLDHRAICHLSNKYTYENSSRFSLKLRKEYEDCFAESEMDITPGEVVCQEQFFFDRDPKKYPTYPIPVNLESTAIEIAEQWVKAGVLKRGTATLNHPTMLVKKPNGTYRLVTDLRKINDITKKLDIRQKPVMETIMEMKPFYYCSRIDLKSAYAQFMLHENNRNDFGLTVGSRNYIYLTLPMGAKNSSHLLHIEMQKIFATLIKSKELVLYHDDALLLTDDTDPEIHMNLLRRFFSLMRKYKLKASFSKSSFFLKQVEFLSFTFDKEGWKPSQSSTTKILNSKIPQTKKQLLRFLLATNYFRSCIKNYSQKSAKLFTLTTGKKNNNIILEGENLKLYKDIVEELMNPQKLNFGDPNKKYYLHTDSSETGLGGCLTQMIDINGVNVEKPLAFYSMKLPYSVRKRHSTYLELKAIVECLKHWAYILIKCKKGIEIICDHKPLTTIKNTATESRFVELLNYLAEFDADITYRKGEDNVVPDWLSRLHEYEKEIQKEDEINLQMVNWTQLEESLHTYAVIRKRKRGRPKKPKVETIDNENEFKLLQMIANQQTILKTEELKEHQEKDETIQKALSTGFHLDYPIKKIDGIVKIKINNRTNEDTEDQSSKEENEGFVCFIPQSLSNKIISLLHENGHFSYLKTRAMLRQLAYCEKMAMNIRKVLNNCLECAKRNSAPTRQPSAKVTSYTEYPMDSLSLDLLCPVIPDGGFKYVMNVQDNCTRYLWSIPLKTKSYKEILNELLRWVMLPFGMAKSIRTDGDGMFSSDNFISECKELGINVIKSTPRDSQSNSLIERTFRTTSAIIYKISCNNNISWSKTLPLVANYINTSKTGNMTYSPYEKLFLQQPHNMITQYLQSNIKYVDRNQDLHELMNVAAYIRHLDNEYSEEIKARINEKAKVLNIIYKPGDKFMYKKNLEGKFKDLYQGPFIVIKDVGTKVTFKAKNGKILTASKAKIKRFYGDL